jgi:hypothetical protein
MPTGFYKHTKNKGSFKKGHKCLITEDTKRKMRIARDGIKLSETHKNNIGKSLLGHKVSIETRIKMSGSNQWNWKGGITPEIRKIRNSLEIKLWRKSVFERDGFTCQKTGLKGGSLVAHHINNFSSFPELRTSIENGITLSKESHMDFHNNYGRRNNTKEQLLEFLATPK